MERFELLLLSTCIRFWSTSSILSCVITEAKLLLGLGGIFPSEMAICRGLLIVASCVTGMGIFGLEFDSFALLLGHVQVQVLEDLPNKLLNFLIVVVGAATKICLPCTDDN